MVLPPTYSNILWGGSWMSLASALYAIHRGHYDLAIIPGGVWLTSINYWRKPDYSWRRYVDISYVHLSLAYQIWRARNSEYRIYYYTTLAIGCSFFPLGVSFYQSDDICKSTLCHLMVHVFGNISNFILYSGYVDGPSQCK